jgi:hypothetical protein
MTKSAKVLRNPYSKAVWEKPNCPPNIKSIVPAFFGDRFVEKLGGLRTYNPSAEEVKRLEVFCIKRIRTLNTNLKFKLKSKK